MFENDLRRDDFLPIECSKKMSNTRKQKVINRSNRKLEKIMPIIKSVVKNIQENGDKALSYYTKKFDKVDIPSSKFLVSKNDVKKAYKKVNDEDNELIKYMQQSIDCIKAYHENEKDYS